MHNGILKNWRSHHQSLAFATPILEENDGLLKYGRRFQGQ